MNPQQKRYGDYELLDFCAEGGFGEVWRARGFDGRVVALKIVGTQYRGDAWKSELKGIQTYQQTVPAHPNLLQIFHVGEAENCFYYTMELADSLSEAGYCADTLAERLKRNGRLNADETLKLVGSLLSGVEALHASGLIHRDIKPANILWVKGVPKLADVGLVRDPAHTVSRGGTPAFFPPESGSSGSSADDFYALSMVVYCALTGFGPERFPEIPTGLPLSEYAALRNVFMRGCSSKAEERFHSAEEFRSILSISPLAAESRKKNRYILPVFTILALGGFCWYCLGNETKIKEEKNFNPPSSPVEPGLQRDVSSPQSDRLMVSPFNRDQFVMFILDKTRREYKTAIANSELLLRSGFMKIQHPELYDQHLKRVAHFKRQVKELDRIAQLPLEDCKTAYKKFMESAPREDSAFAIDHWYELNTCP